MSDADNPREPGALPEPAPDEVLRSIGVELADGVIAALGAWVESAVAQRADAWRPGLASELAEPASQAGRAAVAAVGPQLRSLLALDPEAQGTGPLEVVRRAVAYPTAVLEEAGVPAVVRDEFSERAFPADRYDLSPASFADLDPDLAEVGIRWGAAKAFVVMARHRGDTTP